MIVLDASVVIGHLNPHDAHHHHATSILAAGVPGRMLMHTITIAEVLVGGARIGQGSSMLDDLLAAGISIAPHDDAEPLRLAELRAGTGLKLPDCCVLDAAIQNHAELATFDHGLAEAARSHGLIVAERG